MDIETVTTIFRRNLSTLARENAAARRRARPTAIEIDQLRHLRAA